MGQAYTQGDILIGLGGQAYITQGVEYEVYSVDRDGDAWIRDDDGDDFEVSDGAFTLKSTAPAAKIRIISLPGMNEEGENIVHLASDDAGLGLIAQMIKDTKKASDKAELREKIAELEAQLKAL